MLGQAPGALCGLARGRCWCGEGNASPLRGNAIQQKPGGNFTNRGLGHYRALLVLDKALAQDRATLELIEQASAALERLTGKRGGPQQARA